MRPHSACRCAWTWERVPTGTRRTEAPSKRAAGCVTVKSNSGRPSMRRLLSAMLLACGVCGAHAGNLVYVGAGVVRDKLSNITTADGFTLSDIDRTSWKVLVGLRPISLLAVEANYIDLGGQTNNFVDAETHAQYKAFAGYAVGFLPIPVPFLDVFGKAGLARWQSDGSTVGIAGPANLISFSDRGTEFAWGVGAGAHIGNVGARLEDERFSVANTNGARSISLDAILRP